MVHDQLHRRFLRLSEDHVALNPQALAVGQARFINKNARELVRGVVARMHSAGVLADVPTENPRLVEAWTSQERP